MSQGAGILADTVEPKRSEPSMDGLRGAQIIGCKISRAYLRNSICISRKDTI